MTLKPTQNQNASIRSDISTTENWTQVLPILAASYLGTEGGQCYTLQRIHVESSDNSCRLVFLPLQNVSWTILRILCPIHQHRTDPAHL